MAILKCKMCGGALTPAPNSTIAECEYCGSLQTLPQVNDERLSALYERANDLRLCHEFDKAAEVYEKIIEDNPNDPDVYWSLVLCKYGVQYVQENKGAPRKPTINRAQLTSVTDDTNYRSALKHADAEQKRIYESEAARIDKILQQYLEISRREPPYDVFICYKHTDEYGGRTKDAVQAEEIHRRLVKEGFKVFFAPVTLKGKLGEEYEPYIFSAIHSAKVMVVVGTKPEYMNAVWVKNEWSRFLALAQEDQDKILIPVYGEMRADEMPEAFRFKQAQSMDEIGFMLDLLRGIEKVIEKNKQPAKPAFQQQPMYQQQGYQQSAAPTGNAETMLKRAEIYLEDQDWSNVNKFCENVLNMDPTNGQAYCYKLMAEAHVTSISALQYYHATLDSLKSYKTAVRYADAAVSADLVAYNEKIQQRLTQEREEREAAARAQKERDRIAAEYRAEGVNLEKARSNAASMVASQVSEKERLESIFQNNQYAIHNLTSRKRKIIIPAIICIVFGIIIFTSLVNNTDIGPAFWFMQTIPAMFLAHGRCRSKVKAFFQSIFTVGLFPAFSGLKGLKEALGSSSTKDKQLEQVEIQNNIRELDEQIALTRRSLSELNAKIEEHEARGKDILV